MSLPSKIQTSHFMVYRHNTRKLDLKSSFIVLCLYSARKHFASFTVMLVGNISSLRKKLPFFILLVSSFFLFSFIQRSPVFPDPDSFYHAKMAVLMSKQGVVQDFPYLPYTVLNDYYTDHHFIYHLLLIPFVTLMPPLIGIKVATVFLGMAYILTFYFVLNRNHIRGAFWWALLLLFIPAFIFRLNLAKAPALALILTFLSIHAMFQKKYLMLFFLSIFYVLSYGGWIVMLILAMLYNGARIFTQKISLFFHNDRARAANQEKFDWKLLSLVIVGIIVGILIHPYFPDNLSFYWQQTVQIGLINYQNKIGVGGEWYSYPIGELIHDTQPLIIIVLLGLFCFVFRFERQNHKTWFSVFLLALFLFAVTKSRRYVEYFVPFSVLFAALSLNQFQSTKDQTNKELIPFGKLLTQENLFQWMLMFFFIFTFPIQLIKNIRQVRTSFQTGYTMDQFSGAATWLKQHSTKGDIVFHSDWDEFPPLFFYNSHNRYIAGLDPTFLYKADPNLHQKFVNISTGQEIDHLYNFIKNDFQAKYVFVDTTHEAFKKNLDQNFHFTEMYHDEQSTVFKVEE